MTKSGFDTKPDPLNGNRLPTVTIVIPCYNYGHFLPQCLTSVLAQTGIEIRVLVVDDGSKDNSAAVAASFAKEDSRVELISLPRNVGMIPAVTLGLREVTSDYLVKLDADDLLSPGSLERSVALLQRHPNVGFVYGRPRHFTDDVPLPRRGVPRWTIWPGTDWFATRCRQAVNCISQPEAMIRNSVLREIGGYNASLPHTSDVEMWLRL
jgi:glycosyltransferase involved in cell wall biosynthesis